MISALAGFVFVRAGGRRAVQRRMLIYLCVPSAITAAAEFFARKVPAGTPAVQRLHARARRAAGVFASCSINACLRERPQRYPARLPSSRTTRWHGTTIDTGFVAHARATARTAFGFPTACATCEYVFVVPEGMRCSSCHTRR